MMDFAVVIEYLKSYVALLPGWSVYPVVIILLLIYRKLRFGRWKAILQESIDYHKFHLLSINKAPSTDDKSRELAQALFWAATKQLAADFTGAKGGRLLLRSFYGEKTALNTCYTVYYECAGNYSYIDKNIIRLNETLISTIYRIYLIESWLSFLNILYSDIVLFFCRILKPEKGAWRLYLEISLNSNKK